MMIYLATFHVPAFYFITGYLRNENKTLKSILKKRILRLILPWFIFSIASFAIWYMITENVSYNDGLRMFYGYLYSNYLYIEYFNVALWFLPSLFLTEIAYELVVRLSGNLKYILLVGMCLFGFYWIRFVNIPLPWNLEVSLVGLAFFYFGHIIAKNQKSLEPILEHDLFIPAALLLQVLFAYFNFLSIGTNVNMAFSRYGNLIFFFGGALSGIILLFILSMRIKSNVLVLCGQYTLTLLVTHSIYYYELPEYFFQQLLNISIHDTFLKGKPIQFSFLIVSSLLSFYAVWYHIILRNRIRLYFSQGELNE